MQKSCNRLLCQISSRRKSLSGELATTNFSQGTAGTQSYRESRLLSVSCLSAIPIQLQANWQKRHCRHNLTVLNRSALEAQVALCSTKECIGAFFILDIDHFKWVMMGLSSFWHHCPPGRRWVCSLYHRNTFVWTGNGDTYVLHQRKTPCKDCMNRSFKPSQMRTRMYKDPKSNALGLVREKAMLLKGDRVTFSYTREMGRFSG